MKKETKKCCLCGCEIQEPFTNNPYPLCDVDDYESRCCSKCDQDLVVPARFYASKLELDCRKQADKCLMLSWLVAGMKKNDPAFSSLINQLKEQLAELEKMSTKNSSE